MAEYKYTQHTLGHIALHQVDDKGNVVMTKPAAADVAAAIAANKAHEAVVKAAVKSSAMNAVKDVARKVQAGNAAAARVRVADKVKIPKATPVVEKDVLMSYGNVYELPADNKQVKHYVQLGYLKEESGNVESGSRSGSGSGRAESERAESGVAAPVKKMADVAGIAKAKEEMAKAQSGYDLAMKEGDAGVIAQAEKRLAAAKDALTKAGN